MFTIIVPEKIQFLSECNKWICAYTGKILSILASKSDDGNVTGDNYRHWLGVRCNAFLVQCTCLSPVV